MSAGLTDEEQSQWRSQGFFVRENQFEGEALRLLQDAVEAAAERARQACPDGRTYWLDGKRFVDVGHRTVQFEHLPGTETVRVIEPVHDLHELLDALVDDPRLVGPMRDLIGASDVTLWTDKLNLKRPLEGSGFGWHQDSPYWMHDCQHDLNKLPNVMLMLDDAHAGNGCFRVIAGSHLQGCLPGMEDGSQLGGFYTDPGCFSLSDQVALEVPAGSLVFFHPHTVHGSEPNRSRLPRRALIYTYQPAGYAMLKSGLLRRSGAGEAGARRVHSPVGG